MEIRASVMSGGRVVPAAEVSFEDEFSYSCPLNNKAVDYVDVTTAPSGAELADPCLTCLPVGMSTKR